MWGCSSNFCHQNDVRVSLIAPSPSMISRADGRLLGFSSRQLAITSATSCGHSSGTLQPKANREQGFSKAPKQRICQPAREIYVWHKYMKAVLGALHTQKGSHSTLGCCQSVVKRRRATEQHLLKKPVANTYIPMTRAYDQCQLLILGVLHPPEKQSSHQKGVQFSCKY